MLNVIPGENFLLQRQFMKTDKVTPIVFADIVALTCSLLQRGVEIAKYEYTKTPSAYSSGFSHLGNSEFQVEVSKAISSKLGVMPLSAKWILQITNSDFALDGGTQTFIDTLEVANVY